MHLKPYLLILQGRVVRRRHKHGEVLAGIILSKWGSLLKERANRCISNEEFRDILVKDG